jgi:hypothetical protein
MAGVTRVAARRERARRALLRAQGAQAWAPHTRRTAPPRPRGHMARGSGR